MKSFTLFLGLSLAMTSAALAQTPAERARAALPADAARTLDQTLTSARSRGLPTEPLVDKALEGIAKHAPANLILDAVRKRLELLSRADAVLRPFGPPAAEDVTSVADALQRGLSEDVVKRVRAGARSGEPVALALHTLADLLERGVPVDVAFDMLSAWRSHGADPDELRQMPEVVDRMIRNGDSPGAAGRAVAASVGRGNAGQAPGLQKKAEPKANPSSGRVRPPIPPGSGVPSRGRKGKPE